MIYHRATSNYSTTQITVEADSHPVPPNLRRLKQLEAEIAQAESRLATAAKVLAEQSDTIGALNEVNRDLTAEISEFRTQTAKMQKQCQ